MKFFILAVALCLSFRHSHAEASQVADKVKLQAFEEAL